MATTSRWAIAASLALAGLIGAGVFPRESRAAPCEQLKGETVNLIVTYPAGGGYDQYARLLAPHLEQAIGAEVVVSNEGGAGGMIGVKSIRDAAPDGKTLGLMSGNNLLVQAAFGGSDVPSPTQDFTMLGQITDESMVWVVPASSPITSVEMLWQQPKPMVAGATGGGTTILLALAGGAKLAGIDAEYVGGYRGSRDVVLALMRGELDVTALGYESTMAMVASGEVRAILALADKPSDLSLRDVPFLGGPEGIAARRASATGRTVPEAVAMASSMSELLQERRIVVAPKGLDPALAACLESGFLEAAGSAAFAADAGKAGRDVKLLGRAELTERLGKAEEAAKSLAPIAQEAAGRLRS